MARKAVVLCGNAELPDPYLTQILDFFEIPWEGVSLAALFDPRGISTPESYALFSTLPLMGRIWKEGAVSGTLPPLLQRAKSIFLFGGEESQGTDAVLQFLTGGSDARIARLDPGETPCSISDKHVDICGPLSGLRVTVPVRLEFTILANSSTQFERLIWSKEGCLFGVAACRGKQFYLAPSSTLIDVNAPVKKTYFDIADYFLSAVPLVMYLQLTFRGVIPRSADNGACLIVDDPALRTHYGFVDLQRLAILSAEHRFTCSIAFIPWNWNRSRSSAVELFRRHADRLSLSIHGCDHTGGEFAVRNTAVINRQSKLALARMEKHAALTGLPYDRVMIFPQGAFSSASLGVLKHNGFIAAVNTEVSPTDQRRSATVGDVWRLAILKYADFAIYTRRYSFHGVHNFAFDLLLGKPCLIVTHHADFQDGGRDVVDFIDRLNSLPFPLVWRGLGDVVRHAYQQRLREDGTYQIRMWGGEILIPNPAAHTHHFVVEKRERTPEGIERVDVSGRPVAFHLDGGQMRFELEVGPKQAARIRIAYRDTFGAPPKAAWSAQFKVAARRYLSEGRDEAQPLIRWISGKT